MSNVFGVDISEHNGAINWPKLKTTGNCSFAVIRIGHGTTLDERFYANLAAAKTNNVPYAFYLYAEANTASGAEAEARFAISKISGSKPLFVAYDAECAALSAESKNQTTDIACAFLNLIHSAGFRPYLYCNRNWEINEIDVQFCKNKGYGFWLAWYGAGNPLTTDKSSLCDIWQYSETGTLAGNGSCHIDLDVVYNPQIKQLICGSTISPTYCDTTMPVKIKHGQTYTMATGSKNVTTGNGAVVQTAGQTYSNGKYYTVLKAVGSVGQATGVYLNGAQKFVATVI